MLKYNVSFSLYTVGGLLWRLWTLPMGLVLKCWRSYPLSELEELSSWKYCTELATLLKKSRKRKEGEPLMQDKLVVITGANTGIGKRTAYHLARLGAKVIIACRNKDKAVKAQKDILAELKREQGGGVMSDGSAAVEVMLLDLQSSDSVRKFADEFTAKHTTLDVLVNNAGCNTHGSLPSGLEQCFTTNFLGHFYLTKLLMTPLQNASEGRVVNLASVMHHWGPMAEGKWEEVATASTGAGIAAIGYAASKLAMVLFTRELNNRFKAAKASTRAVAVNPGAVRSDIWRSLPWVVKPFMDLIMRVVFLNVDQGAYTSVFCAAAPHLDHEYYQPYWLPLGDFLRLPFEIMGPFIGSSAMTPTYPEGNDDDSAKDLWSACERLLEVYIKAG